MGNLTLNALRFHMFSRYGLEEYYNDSMGNVLVPEDDLSPDIRFKIDRFLKCNTDWVMGYENTDEYHRILYITKADEL